MLNNLLRRVLGGAPRDEAERTLALARALLAQDRRTDAIDLLDPLIERQPDGAEARFLRGTALLETDRPGAALPDLARAAALKPAESRYLHNLALAYWKLGEAGKSADLCKAVLRISAFNPTHILLSAIEMPGEEYYQVLLRIQDYLRPRTYLEIGTYQGASLNLAHPHTLAIGIDPEPRLKRPLGPNARVFAQTSDAFFAGHDVIAELGGHRVELAFIDGMHHFEYALRDFINLERLCNRDSVILVHDCYPIDALTASRERSSAFWSGDIWRLMLLLRQYRPDLSLHTIATPPTGLGVILGLDPDSRLLEGKLDSIVAEYMAKDYRVLEGRKEELLGRCSNDWPAIRALLDTRIAA